MTETNELEIRRVAGEIRHLRRGLITAKPEAVERMRSRLDTLVSELLVLREKDAA